MPNAGGVPYATSINNAGLIVGGFHFGFEHAFLYKNGSTADLSTLGGNSSSANDVNDRGEVVGSSTVSTYDDFPHAFIYKNGKMTNLDPHDVASVAESINSDGQVVGRITIAGESHAALFSDGGVRDLNDFILPGFGLTLIDAVAINDLGQIAGDAIDQNGKQHGFLLTPTASSSSVTPEPTMLSFLAMPLVALLCRRSPR